MNPDSKLYQAFYLAADVVIVNFLLLLTALPIFTFGAGLRAANATLADLIAGGAGPSRTFWHAFRTNIGAVTLWWTILLLLGALGLYEWLLLSQFQSGIEFALRVGLICAAIIIAGTSLWFFFDQSQEPLPFTAAAQRALLKFFTRLGTSLLGVALLGAPLALLLVRWPSLMAFYLIIGLALTLYLFQLVAARKSPKR